MEDSNKTTEEINTVEGHWYCIICGADMGTDNPRQFCRKTYCENEFQPENHIKRIWPKIEESTTNE